MITDYKNITYNNNNNRFKLINLNGSKIEIDNCLFIDLNYINNNLYNIDYKYRRKIYDICLIYN